MLILQTKMNSKINAKHWKQLHREFQRQTKETASKNDIYKKEKRKEKWVHKNNCSEEIYSNAPKER